MKTLGKIIKYLLFGFFAVRSVQIGIVEGWDWGLISFLLMVFLYLTVYRVVWGPRDFSYGYKNGYRNENPHFGWHGTGAYEPGEVFEKDIKIKN